MIFIELDGTLINVDAIQTVVEWNDPGRMSDTASFTRIGLIGGEAFFTRKTVDEVRDAVHAATEPRVVDVIEEPSPLTWKDGSLPPLNPLCGRRDCDEEGVHGHIKVDEPHSTTASAADLLRERRAREGRPFFEDRDPNRVSESSTLGVLDPDYVAPDPAPRTLEKMPVATQPDRYREGQRRILTSMKQLIEVHNYGSAELLAVIEADLEQGE